MHRFVATTLAAFCVFTATAMAQTAADYSRMMDALSSVEHTLLSQRSALTARESALEDPIWLRDSSGAYQVVSADTYRAQIEALVSVAQLLDLDDAALQQLPLATQIAASILSEDLIAATAVEKILQALRDESARIRSGAMQGFEAALEKTQSDFAAAMQARDQLLSGDPDAPVYQTGLCGQPAPADATVFAWTFSGPSTFYWDAGGIYCDTYNNAAVVKTGNRLVYFECSDSSRASCERQEDIYEIDEVEDGVHSGRRYLSPENYQTNASASTFTWRQCRPALGDAAPC